jgi:assimilatory nitrate reductase catalytic subunit
MRRIAVRGEDGGLAGALFVTRNGTLPPRGWIAEQLGVDGAATEWLAGRPSTPPRIAARLFASATVWAKGY